MLGAIFGDIVGSVYEFNNTNNYNFPLLSDRSRLTDDSLMTLAVAKALMETWGQPDDAIRAALVREMRDFGRRYPNGGYGGRFRQWLVSDDPQPYGSFGNGSAMRVSPAGWLYGTMEETLHAAKLTAEVTHNHPEGIKGAQAIAAGIFLARSGQDKDAILEYITQNFGYDLTRTLDEIRPTYGFYEICQKSVPEAIRAFYEGTDYEDVIRKAVALGGDSDTIACMAGALAEAYYGMPEAFRKETLRRMDAFQRSVAKEFHDFYRTHLGKPAASSPTDSVNASSVETAESQGEKKITKKNDWKTFPMPAQRDTFLLSRHFSKQELSALQCGHIPEAMEDKWFWYMEGNTLFAHRSWTGYCIYILELNEQTGIHKVTVNRDPEQYQEKQIKEDENRLNELLNWWTKPAFDFYHEWLSETLDSLQKKKAAKQSPPKVVRFHKLNEDNAWLSNWYPSTFVLDGKSYCCAEQYLMEQKAVLFGDTQMAARIMQTDDPAEMQKFGWGVAGFDSHIWDGRKQLILYKALCAKFRQNPELQSQLLDTGKALLVECARSDRVWGAGLGMQDDRADSPKTWAGQNLLGLTLMAVREELAEENTASEDICIYDTIPAGSVMPSWGEHGNHIFWFSPTVHDGQKLIRPDGTFTVCERQARNHFKDDQAHEGWQRANLLMDEYEIRDATSFGCSMASTLIASVYDRANNKKVLYLFYTCQNAVETVYPCVPKSVEKQCRKNVERFYANPGLQAGWNSFILYPVCIKIVEGDSKFYPVFLGELGDNETCLRIHSSEWGMISLDNKQSIQEAFRNEHLW